MKNTVYRVSIHNQIYATTYYVVTGWNQAKNGGWVFNGYRNGERGKSNALGLSYGDAVKLARELNKKVGWVEGDLILNSMSKPAFKIYA